MAPPLRTGRPLAAGNAYFFVTVLARISARTTVKC